MDFAGSITGVPVIADGVVVGKAIITSGGHFDIHFDRKKMGQAELIVELILNGLADGITIKANATPAVDASIQRRTVDV